MCQLFQYCQRSLFTSVFMNTPLAVIFHNHIPQAGSFWSGAEQHAGQRWADTQLAEARALVDLPALAPPDAILMGATALHNTFTCQPQASSSL